MKIIITKCTNKNYWYSNAVTCEFYVQLPDITDECGSDNYCLIGNEHLYIYKGDCHVIMEESYQNE